ncbi:hypothetical protein [Streptomyces sp. ACT015]|uniref:hypothetical protein n=1 Tax=Streptomyces sp. ACT015 TaxID=3134807 RepID=UPI003D16D753
MTQRDAHDRLRARLREAADAHQPDRARVLARIERGMARPGGHPPRPDRSSARGWLRVAGAAGAVAGMLALGGYAVASAVRDDAPRERTVAVSPTPAPSRDPAGPTSSPGGDPSPGVPPDGGAASRAPAAPSAPASASAPSADGERDGPLRSDGVIDPHSNDFWAQSDLTVRTSAQLTSLTVELSVAQTGGVSSTGAWRSLPEQDFTQTARERDGRLVFTWVLRPGRTVPAGSWVFAGQYDHERGGRDAGGDSYAVSGTAAGVRYAVRGGFAAGGGG